MWKAVFLSLIPAVLLGGLIAAAAMKHAGGIVSPYEHALETTVKIEHGTLTGSGTVLTDDGLVLTNAHVVAGVEEALVTFRDGRQAKARVLWRGHRNNDLALMELVHGGEGESPWGLEPTELDLDGVEVRHRPLEVGEKVFAVGHSRAHFDWSVAVGHVAHVDRSFGDGFTPHSVQVDVGIHPGNSGGGLYDAEGRFVGLVFSGNQYPTMYGGVATNLNFVIPISVVCRAAPCGA